MFVPEMAYFPVTFCQGFGAKFGKLNNEDQKSSKKQIVFASKFFVL